MSEKKPGGEDFFVNKNPLGIGTENGDHMYKELVLDQLDKYQNVLGSQVVRLLTDSLPERTNASSMEDPNNPGNFIVQEAGNGWSRVYERIEENVKISFTENVTKEPVKIIFELNREGMKTTVGCSVRRAVLGGEKRCLIQTITEDSIFQKQMKGLDDLVRTVSVSQDGKVDEQLVAMKVLDGEKGTKHYTVAERDNKGRVRRSTRLYKDGAMVDIPKGTDEGRKKLFDDPRIKAMYKKIGRNPDDELKESRINWPKDEEKGTDIIKTTLAEFNVE